MKKTEGKTSSNFKMKKKYKMLLANYGADKEMYHHMKRLFIKAQVADETSERVVFK